MAGRYGGLGIWRLTGAAAVLCTALLGLYPTVAQTPPGITAEHGIAAGRDVNIGGNVILHGWTPVQVKDVIDRKDAAEQEIRHLSTQLSVTDNAVRTFLSLLAEREVPVENLTLKLVEIAQTHKALLAQVRSAPSDDPRGAELKQQAARAIEQGQYERAETLLTEVRDIKLAAVRRRQEAIQREQEEADRELLEAAQAQADLGEMKGAQLQYLDASVAFSKLRNWSRRSTRWHGQTISTVLA